jgi:hypothetical protein
MLTGGRAVLERRLQLPGLGWLLHSPTWTHVALVTLGCCWQVTESAERVMLLLLLSLVGGEEWVGMLHFGN